MSLLAPFENRIGPRMLFGAGVLADVGRRVSELGLERVLIVSDPGVTASGHVERLRENLEQAGVSCRIFAESRENPTSRDVELCREAAESEPPGESIQGFVALGGGSSIDTARAANLLVTNGGRIKDYKGYGNATRALLPLIAIPTTAGTGSEMQSYALIADPKTHDKMACGDPRAMAELAVLDPELTLTLPPAVTATSGLDALVHAVETAVTTRRNLLSGMYSFEAFRLIEKHFGKVLENGEDIEARGAMQLGAAFAGLAIESSMLGAAHACANPLTAQFGIAHGKAVAMMLPRVLRFNAEDPVASSIYRDLATRAELVEPKAATPKAVARLAMRIEELIEKAGLPRTLAELDVTEDAIDALATAACEQWTGQFNPRPVDVHAFKTLYHAAITGDDKGLKAG